MGFFRYVHACLLLRLAGVAGIFHRQTGARFGVVFSSFVAYGIALWLGVQSFFHIGVNIGLLPTKGLTLPLVSYGGSAAVVMLVSMACCCAWIMKTAVKCAVIKVEG